MSRLNIHEETSAFIFVPHFFGTYCLYLNFVGNGTSDASPTAPAAAVQESNSLSSAATANDPASSSSSSFNSPAKNGNSHSLQEDSEVFTDDVENRLHHLEQFLSFLKLSYKFLLLRVKILYAI